MYSRTKLPESLPAETVGEPWRQQLLNAAEYIRVHGHCKHAFRTPAGEVCAWGAIIHAAKSEPDRITAYVELEGFVDGADVPSWNDAPETTAEIVIAALEGAARSALREGGGK